MAGSWNMSAGNMPAGQANGAGFAANTRQSWIQGNPISYAPNAPQTQQLLQVGFLSRIILSHTLTFTTASTGTYANTTADPPTPWSFIKRIRLYTNEGQELWNTSGYGAYLHERILAGGGLDPRNPITSFASTNTAAAVYSIPTTYTNSVQYNIQFYTYMDIAWDDALYAGLIFLQNPTNRLSLEITTGDNTSILTLGGTTPLITVNSYSCIPLIEVFQLPTSAQNWPDLSWAHAVGEDSNNPVSNTGDNAYKPLLGPTYLSIVQSWINNTAQMVPTNFSQMRITYQGTQTAYVMTPINQLTMQRRRYGADMPDGVFVHDFRMGSGMPEVASSRDLINTAQLTDFEVITTVSSGVTLTNANFRAVREMLWQLQTTG